jgi:hypothetical protein
VQQERLRNPFLMEGLWNLKELPAPLFPGVSPLFSPPALSTRSQPVRRESTGYHTHTQHCNYTPDVLILFPMCRRLNNDTSRYEN